MRFLIQSVNNPLWLSCRLLELGSVPLSLTKGNLLALQSVHDKAPARLQSESHSLGLGHTSLGLLLSSVQIKFLSRDVVGFPLGLSCCHQVQLVLDHTKVQVIGKQARDVSKCFGF